MRAVNDQICFQMRNNRIGFQEQVAVLLSVYIGGVVLVVKKLSDHTLEYTCIVMVCFATRRLSRKIVNQYLSWLVLAYTNRPN